MLQMVGGRSAGVRRGAAVFLPEPTRDGHPAFTAAKHAATSLTSMSDDETPTDETPTPQEEPYVWAPWTTAAAMNA